MLILFFKIIFIEIFESLEEWDIMIWFLSFLLNTIISFPKKFLSSVYKLIFHNSFTFIVINLGVQQSFYSLDLVLVDEFSNKIIFLLRHMNVVCSQFNVDSSKLGWSNPASESVSAFKDYVRYSFFGECSGGSNAWNTCTDDDDLMDWLHLRYYDLQICVTDLTRYKNLISLFINSK